MKNQLTLVDPSEFGLKKEEALELTKNLDSIIKERKTLSEIYERIVRSEITDDLSKEAHDLRIKIRDNRTKGLNKWHKANKQYFLAGGKFVDAIKNKNIVENERMEDKLLSIEKYKENLEKERKDKLKQERLSKIQQYIEDGDLDGVDLGDMNDTVWDSFLKSSKEKYNQKLKEEEERKEAERKEAERIKKIEEENKKIKKELEEKRKKELEVELAEKEKERKAKEERERLSKAPLKEKLSNWVDSFSIPKIEDNSDTKKDIEDKFNSFKKWANKQVDNL